MDDQGEFRILVEALQVGHVVKRSRTCGLRTNEYIGATTRRVDAATTVV